MRSKIPWTDAIWNPDPLHPERLGIPQHWRKRRRVSVSDVFHEDVPDEFIDRVFATMGFERQHTFQVLTKQPARMAEYVRPLARHPNWPFANVHLGVSAEDQPWADRRVTELLATPAAVRFVSFEPLLGPIDARPWLYKSARCDICGEPKSRTNVPGDETYLGWPSCLNTACPAYGEQRASVSYRGSACLDWVIVGGESGGPENRRLVERCNSPCHRYDCDGCPDCDNSGYHPKPEALGWVRSLRDQCVAAGVPFFFKGFGGPTQKSGGRLLDGREWDEMPRQEVG